MKINAAPRILIVAGVCVLALIGLVVSEGFARQGGQDVLLPMEAVDPRSLLSGHYVQLNLTQRLEPNETCPSVAGEEWIALREAGEAHVAIGTAASREQAQLLGLPIRGQLTCSAPAPGSDLIEGTPGWVQLDLGFDRFHINQTEALRIERVLREQTVNEATRAYAIVSVGRDGRGRLRGLVVDGERFELDWL
ncbi:MAG: GDYXXLXY domain-containing protein [Phycisphaerales bacterium]|nr:GDYXXLXY domain-containing protein [Hyphomonadaceae bacterium]